MQEGTEIFITDETMIIPEVCFQHCSVCEGADHHWMPDEEFDAQHVEGMVSMVCKHCPAVREVGDGYEPDDQVRHLVGCRDCSGAFWCDCPGMDCPLTCGCGENQ